MIGARASGVAMILALAAAFGLFSNRDPQEPFCPSWIAEAAAQAPEGPETLGNPAAGRSGPKAAEPNLAPLTLNPQRMPPPPGAGAAAAMNAPQATLDYASDPATPRAGSNTFRVKLTGADGTAIAGAQVTVTFFMPAMPAMGMAAMRNVVTLSNKGGGLYEGAGEVQMGGNWQVTVLATKAGQTIAQKQFSVTTEGGM